MGFFIHTSDVQNGQPLEYLPAGAITPKLGLALVVTSGKLAVCGATAKPTYICMMESDEALTAGDVIPVQRVSPQVTYETTASVELATGSADAKTPLPVGSKVTLSSDGMSITATTTNGVAEIVSMDGTAAGSKVRVRFA